MWRSQQQLKSLRYTLTHPQQILPWFQSMIPRILHPELTPALLWQSASQALKSSNSTAVSVNDNNKEYYLRHGESNPGLPRDRRGY